jgi:hypothetical protein
MKTTGTCTRMYACDLGVCRHSWVPLLANIPDTARTHLDSLLNVHFEDDTGGNEADRPPAGWSRERRRHSEPVNVPTTAQHRRRVCQQPSLPTTMSESRFTGRRCSLPINSEQLSALGARHHHSCSSASSQHTSRCSSELRIALS